MEVVLLVSLFTLVVALLWYSNFSVFVLILNMAVYLHTLLEFWLFSHSLMNYLKYIIMYGRFKTLRNNKLIDPTIGFVHNILYTV